MADPFETEAKAWMEKAWRDLEMAQRAVAVMPPFYDMAVYHCQQSGPWLSLLQRSDRIRGGDIIR